jgi:hypothetical protein
LSPILAGGRIIRPSAAPNSSPGVDHPPFVSNSRGNERIIRSGFTSTGSMFAP